MAAYRRVDNLIIITCGLTACTPGSARGPALGNEYGNVLSFLYCTRIQICQSSLLSGQNARWPRRMQLYGELADRADRRKLFRYITLSVRRGQLNN